MKPAHGIGFGKFDNLFGIDDLTLMESSVSDSDLKKMPWLGNLKTLLLNRTQITSDGLISLDIGPELGLCAIDETAVDRVGVEHILQNAPNLQFLTIPDIGEAVVDELRLKYPDVLISVNPRLKFHSRDRE